MIVTRDEWGGMIYTVHPKVRVEVRPYMMGQYRVQLTYDFGHGYPDILSPEC